MNSLDETLVYSAPGPAAESHGGVASNSSAASGRAHEDFSGAGGAKMEPPLPATPVPAMGHASARAKASFHEPIQGSGQRHESAAEQPGHVQHEAQDTHQSQERKEFLWYLSRFFTRQFYALFVGVSVLILVWPGLSPAVGGTAPWRLLLDLTVYEVMLVDVICKRHIPWKRPDQPRNGFPSGHATFSFAVAGLVGVLHPHLAVGWLVAAVCIGWSRLYLRGHYFYQVAAGALFGFLLAAWVLWR